jgi:hypothetical protein
MALTGELVVYWFGEIFGYSWGERWLSVEYCF